MTENDGQCHNTPILDSTFVFVFFCQLERTLNSGRSTPSVSSPLLLEGVASYLIMLTCAHFDDSSHSNRPHAGCKVYGFARRTDLQRRRRSVCMASQSYGGRLEGPPAPCVRATFSPFLSDSLSLIYILGAAAAGVRFTCAQRVYRSEYELECSVDLLSNVR